jgi:uncharacterized protein YndB with AHSA1/START domain
MKRTLRKTVEYRHPPERVWRALTDSRALAAWLMPNDFVPEVGHEFQFRTDPAPGFDGIVNCKVLELDPPSAMRWSWRGGPIDTVVSFRLEPIADGTRLHFEQAGFDGLKAVLVSFILGSGFGKMYKKLLPAVLDQLADGSFDAGGDDAPSPTCEPASKATARVIGAVADKVPARK